MVGVPLTRCVLSVSSQHEAEEAKKQAKTLQGQLEAVTYTPESANGRRLRAQLITWQKENDELAAQVSEGTVHKLECEVALLKDYLTAVKRADHQLVCSITASWSTWTLHT